jgi:hypothetical protein|tara:strand:- start:644 stop:811 length:168 start_codon:yes stop_codon:yes gene_type:complete
MHAACHPVCLAELNAGRRRAAKMAIIAITTSSSINVNPLVTPFSLKVAVRALVFT